MLDNEKDWSIFFEPAFMGLDLVNERTKEIIPSIEAGSTIEDALSHCISYLAAHRR